MYIKPKELFVLCNNIYVAAKCVFLQSLSYPSQTFLRFTFQL